MKTLGQIAFEAAAEAAGWVMHWEDVKQEKWEAAALAIAKHENQACAELCRGHAEGPLIIRTHPITDSLLKIISEDCAALIEMRYGKQVEGLPLGLVNEALPSHEEPTL